MAARFIATWGAQTNIGNHCPHTDLRGYGRPANKCLYLMAQLSDNCVPSALQGEARPVPGFGKNAGIVPAFVSKE